MRTAHVHAASLTDVQQTLVAADGPWARACRDVWNAGLDERLGALKAARGRTMPQGWWPSYASQCRGLAAAKPVAPWLAEAPAHVLQQVLRDLDVAWWAWLKGGQGRPRFRALKRSARNWWAPSYRFPDRRQFTVERTSKRQGRARLPKIGTVSFRWDRDLPDGATITNVTLKRDRVGDWTVTFALDVPDVEVAHPHPGSAVGVDVGVVVLAATSDGQLFDRDMLGRAGLGPDLFTDGERERLRRLEAKKARQQRGSKNLARTRRQIATLKRTQARRRNDLTHKVSHRLATGYETVAVEDLNVRSMTRSARGTVESPGTRVRQKAGLNRSIAGKGWGMLRTLLAYKTVRAGGTLVEVDPRNTSITCHVCHTVDAGSRENQAEFVCAGCGHVCHADVNAAANILARAVPAGQVCQGPAVGLAVAACGALPPPGRAKKHEPFSRPQPRQAA